MTYEDGLREGRRLALIEAAEIADSVADVADATAFDYESDSAVLIWRARERGARDVAERIGRVIADMVIA